jgi:hypothetical protein
MHNNILHLQKVPKSADCTELKGYGGFVIGSNTDSNKKSISSIVDYLIYGVLTYCVQYRNPHPNKNAPSMLLKERLCTSLP